MIITANGGMEISQEFGTSAVTIAGTGAVQHTSLIDNWYAGYKGSFVLSFQQVTDAPPGFRNSLKMTVTTAQASFSTASDVIVITQPIEGTRITSLAYGNAAAQPVAIGFWVRAHRIGTYSGSIKNAAGTRSYPFNFTISAADTWEFKTAAIAGETTGTWITATAAAGLYLTVCLASGSTLLGTANVWASTNYDGVTGTINGVASTSDTFYLSGVAAIAGNAIPDNNSALLMRSYAEELALLQKYFVAISSGNIIGMGFTYTTTSAVVLVPLSVPLMISPVGSLSAASDFNLLGTGASVFPVTALIATTGGDELPSVQLNLSVASGLVVDRPTGLQRANSNAALKLNARML